MSEWSHKVNVPTDQSDEGNCSRQSYVGITPPASSSKLGLLICKMLVGLLWSALQVWACGQSPASLLSRKPGEDWKRRAGSLHGLFNAQCSLSSSFLKTHLSEASAVEMSAAELI